MICNTQIHDELMNIGQSACPFCGLLLVKGDTLVPQRLNYITEDPLREFLRIQEVLKFSEKEDMSCKQEMSHHSNSYCLRITRLSYEFLNQSKASHFHFTIVKLFSERQFHL